VKKKGKIYIKKKKEKKGKRIKISVISVYVNIFIQI
jgi:hypothetical protein